MNKTKEEIKELIIMLLSSRTKAELQQIYNCIIGIIHRSH